MAAELVTNEKRERNTRNKRIARERTSRIIGNKCQNLVCIEQRKIATISTKERYKEHNYCTHCRTCWKKPLRCCKCCGHQLRKNTRKKTR